VVVTRLSTCTRFMLSLITRMARQRLCVHPVQYRAIQHHLTRTCPSCHQPLPSPLPACSNCWSIFQVPSEVTHHQLFELPYEPNPFTINMPLLKKRFLEAQAICHPDTWSTKGPVSLRASIRPRHLTIPGSGSVSKILRKPSQRD
jgi:hypothetical protein